MIEKYNSVTQKQLNSSISCQTGSPQETAVQFEEEIQKKDENSQKTQNSQSKLQKKLLFSLIIGIFILIASGITVYIMLSTDARRTLPKKVLMEIESNSDTNQGKQEIYLNYEDQIMQLNSKQTKKIEKNHSRLLSEEETYTYEKKKNCTQKLQIKKIMDYQNF